MARVHEVVVDEGLLGRDEAACMVRRSEMSDCGGGYLEHPKAVAGTPVAGLQPGSAELPGATRRARTEEVQGPSWGAAQEPSWGIAQEPSWGTAQEPSWGAAQEPSWGAAQEPSWVTAKGAL